MLGSKLPGVTAGVAVLAGIAGLFYVPTGVVRWVGRKSEVPDSESRNPSPAFTPGADYP
jgi:hypothetical protein